MWCQKKKESTSWTPHAKSWHRSSSSGYWKTSPGTTLAEGSNFCSRACLHNKKIAESKATFPPIEEACSTVPSKCFALSMLIFHGDWRLLATEGQDALEHEQLKVASSTFKDACVFSAIRSFWHSTVHALLYPTPCWSSPLGFYNDNGWQSCVLPVVHVHAMDGIYVDEHWLLFCWLFFVSF